MNTTDNRPVITDYPFGIFNIELTNKCPMRCVMCPRTNNMTRKQGYMVFSVFKKIINELTAANPDYINNQPVWFHHFGESLMHPELGSFFQYAADRRLFACLSINPFMLKEKKALELLNASPHMIYVSLDGHDEESFYKIRGRKNSYQLSHDRLINFLKLKKQLKVKTHITLSMIDFSLNSDSIAVTRDYWESIEGVDQFLIKNFSTWDGNASDVNKIADNANKAGNIQNKAVCDFPWERMTVLWDGCVVPCCYDYDKKYILGNIKKNTLSEIWNSEAMHHLRGEFNSNLVKNELCRNCEKLRLPRHLWRW